MSWVSALPRVAIIGSRETPSESLDLLRQVGKTLADRGLGLTSGDADGADLAGYEGFVSSSIKLPGAARIYLPWENMRYPSGRTRTVDNETFICPKSFPNYWKAFELAFQARGSFLGLGRGGIAMHVRNAYQILQDDLQTPVQAVVCYAPPARKGLAVKGGTNTAYQIAIDYHVPVWNLATPEGLEHVRVWLTDPTTKLTSGGIVS